MLEGTGLKVEYLTPRSIRVSRRKSRAAGADDEDLFRR